MFYKKEIFIISILVLLVSLVPVFWIKEGAILGGGDDNIFLNPAMYFRFSVWDEAVYTSNLSTMICNIFPIGFFWWSLQKMGLNNSLIEQLWLFSMWAISGFSMYFLIRTVFPKWGIWGKIFAILFYYFNLLAVIVPLTIALRYTQAFLPLLLVIFIRGIQSDNMKKIFLYASAFAISGLFCASAFMNPPAASVLFIVPFLYFIYSVLFCPGSVAKKFLFGVLSLSFFCLVNSYWLWSVFYLVFVKSIGSGYEWGYFATRSLADLYRTGGNWWFAKDEFRVHQISFYNNLVIVWLSYFPVLVAFASLFWVKKSKEIVFFVLLLIISLFLAKGTLDPAGGIYGELLKRVGFFASFREPWAKFTLMYALSLSVLLGFSVDKVLGVLGRLGGSREKTVRAVNAKTIFITILIFGVLSTGSQAILGTTVWNYNLVGRRSTVVKFPQYFWDAVHFFNKNDSNSVVYITPRNMSARDYNWESGTSSLLPFSYMFVKNPLRLSNHLLKSGDKNFDNFFVYFGNYNSLLTDNFLNFLNFLGVKYVWQENDVLWGFQREGNYSPRMMEEIFNNSYFLEKEKEFGKVDIFKVKDPYFKPIITVSNRIIVLDGPINSFSSWNKYEQSFFSIVNRENLNFETKDFSLAYISSINTEENLDEVKELRFNISEDGFYDIGINITDDRRVDDFSVRYKIDGGREVSTIFEMGRDPRMEPQLKIVGYRDSFRNFTFGSEFLFAGEHSISIKSPEIKPDFINGINFISFNKYFPSPSAGSGQASPVVHFIKVSSSHYKIKIDPYRGPLILNFAQNFDPNWELSNVKNHFTASGINNEWYLDDSAVNDTSSTELTLYYRPQRWFWGFLVVSGVSLVGLIIGIFVILTKVRIRIL